MNMKESMGKETGEEKKERGKGVENGREEKKTRVYACVWWG